MSKENDLQNEEAIERGLEAGKSASKAEQENSSKSPESFFDFLRDVIDPKVLWDGLLGYLKEHWPPIQERIKKKFGIK